MISIEDPCGLRTSRLACVALALCAAGAGACSSVSKSNGSDEQPDAPKDAQKDGQMDGRELKKASAAGVVFEWRIDGDALEGRMSAKTLGWVTIGFNRARTLDGTRLVMGYVSRGKTVVEEHIADPPNHRPKVELGGKSGVVWAKGREENGTTTIEFRLLLDTGDDFDVALVPGETYYTTFAWSHEDDLYHHSANRTAIDVVL